jgi:hypothetical protein
MNITLLSELDEFLVRCLRCVTLLLNHICNSFICGPKYICNQRVTS